MTDPILQSIEGLDTLKALIENSPVAVYLANMEGQILLTNQAAVKMVGFSREELLGKNIIDLDVVYQNHAQILAFWEAVPLNQVQHIYGKHLCKDGRQIEVEVHSSKIAINSRNYLLGNVTDISERKEWERKITRSEHLLNEAQRLAKIGHWELDFQNNNLIWSDEIYKIVEIDPSNFSVSYEAFLGIVHEDDRESLDIVFKEAIRDKKPYIFRHKINIKDGRIIHVEERAEIYFSDDGIPLSALGTIQDVTEEVETKAKLDQTFEMLNKLVAQVPGVVYQYRLYPDGRSCFPFSSQGMYDIYEHHPEELTEDASLVFKRLHSEDVERVSKEIYESAEKQTIFHSIFRVILPTKGLRWCRCDARPEMLADGSTLWFGIITDITEGIEEHERLVLSEESYRIVANNTYNWEFWEDENKKLLYVSPSCFNITGYTAEEFLNNPALMNDIILLEDQAQFAHHRHHVTSIPEKDKTEFRIRDKQGNVKHIKHLCQPAYDSNGVFRGIRGTNLDITEAVENLKRIEKLLTIEEEQNKRLRNFTHIVSHNLRSHSANMEGLLKLLKIESPEIFNHPYLTMMLKSSENLNETITHLNQVLDISLVNKEEWKKINLLEVINNAVSSVSTLASEVGLKIDVEVDKKIELKAIPAYLDSITLNMLTNAIKFCSEERDSYLHIRAKVEKGFIEISFEDNGIGIDLTKHKEKIFGMYKIIHPRKDSKGLGLFMTLKQVEAMGGKIEVESQENIGTTFNIKLPYESH